MIVENGEFFFGRIVSNDDAIMPNLNNDYNWLNNNYLCDWHRFKTHQFGWQLMWCNFPMSPSKLVTSLNITRSHIEKEQIFNVTNVITNLRWSMLGIENLDWSIIIILRIKPVTLVLGVINLWNHNQFSNI
jgi:hypothetical protein